MIFQKTTIEGVLLVKQEFKEDDRGFFARAYCADEFQKQGLNSEWVQINNSMSVEAGTLRGLHVQSGNSAEVKLVRCISGEIWDVVVDLRSNSPTYSKCFGTVLSACNRNMMYVPKGCAHGFISLTDNTELLYLVSSRYDPSNEHTLIWSDPSVKINWPLNPTVISTKDLSGQSLEDLSSLFA